MPSLTDAGGASASGIASYRSFESPTMNWEGLGPQITVSYCMARDMATNMSLRSSS